MNQAAPLLETTISDYQISDGNSDHLTDIQSKPWAVKVLRGGYGGLRIGLVGPDGVEREFNIEIKDGNVQATVSENAEGDPIAVMTIAQGELHVAAFTNSPDRQNAVVVEKDGIRMTDEYDPPASFGDELTAAPRT